MPINSASDGTGTKAFAIFKCHIEPMFGIDLQVACVFLQSLHLSSKVVDWS